MTRRRLALTAAAAAAVVVVAVVIVVVGDLGRGGNHPSRVADSFELLRTQEPLINLAC
jgi:hypothetical protein